MGEGVEPEFLREVRDALGHLYDHAYLQRHPLTERLAPGDAAAARTRGQELRRLLLDAIEALKPGMDLTTPVPARNPHAILFGLYVQGQEQAQMARRLGICTRQLRRDLAAAIEALAATLYDRHLRSPLPDGSPVAKEPLRTESERLAQGRQPVDLRELVQDLLPLLGAIAAERGIRLQSRVGPGLPQPFANRTLLRQALIGLASQALAGLPLRSLCFETRRVGVAIGVGLALGYAREAPADAGDPAWGLRLESGPLATLARALGASLVREAAGPAVEKVWLLLPVRDEALVLVVDDNDEIFALFERYVAGQPYRLVHAGSVDQALAEARATNPAIIVVDLMMPNRDGWELLQALRSEPATAHISTIVCSVLEEPALARTLGVRACLKKPVGQADLLLALEAAKRPA